MKVWIQWSLDCAQDWEAYEISGPADVEALAKRPVPSGGEDLDGPGWVCGLNCQGIDFTGHDHVAIEVVSGGLRITAWNDDPEDGSERLAVEWTLLEPAHDPLVGEVNTVQQRRIWLNFAAEVPDALPWSEFVPPPDEATLHGIWMSDGLFEEHCAVRSVHGWREWVS